MLHCFGSIWAIVPEIWDSVGNINLFQMMEDFCNLLVIVIISKIWDCCKTGKSEACTHSSLPCCPFAILKFCRILIIIVDFEFDCSLKQSSWCILSRHLSSAQTKAALKPFYFAVHPDLFGQYPIQRVRKTFLPEILKL